MKFIPIDLPPLLMRDEILEKFSIQQNYTYKGSTLWEYEQLTEGPADQIGEFSKDAYSKYPDLIDYLKTNIPYKSWYQCKINLQHGIDPIPMHLDVTNPDSEVFKTSTAHEPCGYRILLRGSKSAVKFTNYQGSVVTASLPTDTDVYVLGQTSAWHAVDPDEGRITIYMSGIVDTVCHQRLIERSIRKYKDYCIY